MKLFTPLLICFFILSNLAAQSKWSLGASVQGGYSGYSSTHTESHLLSGTTNQNLGYQEKRQPSMGLGFWWSRQWSEKWSLHGGVDYIWLKAYIAHDFSSKLLNGTPLNYSLSTFELYQQQLQLPLDVRYTCGKEGWSFKPFVGAGLQLKFLTAEKRDKELTTVQGVQDANTFLALEEVDFNKDFRFINRTQIAAQAEIGLKNDYASLSIRTVFPLQEGAIREKAARRNYICCLEDNSSTPFAGRPAFLLLHQTSLVFQYRLF